MPNKRDFDRILLMMLMLSSPSIGNLKSCCSFGLSVLRGPELLIDVTGGFVLPPSNTAGTSDLLSAINWGRVQDTTVTQNFKQRLLWYLGERKWKLVSDYTAQMRPERFVVFTAARAVMLLRNSFTVVHIRNNAILIADSYHRTVLKRAQTS